jgi:hypothetical protein
MEWARAGWRVGRLAREGVFVVVMDRGEDERRGGETARRLDISTRGWERSRYGCGYKHGRLGICESSWGWPHGSEIT